MSVPKLVIAVGLIALVPALFVLIRRIPSGKRRVRAAWLCGFPLGLALVLLLVWPTPGPAPHAGSLVSQESTEPSSALPTVPAPPGKAMTLLILGVDESKARTDVVIAVRWTPSPGRLTLLSLPRDTRLPIPCTAAMSTCRSPDKLAHAYAYGWSVDKGPETARATVEQFLGVAIDHYLVLDFTAFEEVVDMLGGVSLDVEPGLEDVKLQPGVQTLDGRQALRYVRYRSDGRGDIGRIQRTRSFLLALFVSVRDRHDLTTLYQVAPALLSAVQTDMDPRTALSLGIPLSGLRPDQIQTFSVPGRPLMDQGLWFWEPDQALTAATIKEFLQ